MFNEQLTALMIPLRESTGRLNLNIPVNAREYFRLTDFWTTACTFMLGFLRRGSVL
jgi:hypothetical protein